MPGTITAGPPMRKQDELESVNYSQKEKEMITTLPILLTFSALEQENNLTLPIILAIAGSVALLIGLFGGGVKAKEIEVPTLARGARILSSLFGIGLIGIAIWLSQTPLPQTGSPTSVPMATTEPALSPIMPTSITPTDTST